MMKDNLLGDIGHLESDVMGPLLISPESNRYAYFFIYRVHKLSILDA